MASSSQLTGPVAQPAATKETTSNQQNSPTETIDSKEIIEAFRRVEERLKAQDQVILELRQGQGQPQGQTSPSQYVYANAPGIAGQDFNLPSGSQVSGKDILELIKPFIQPQNPMDSLMSRFLESTIEGAMQSQQASVQLVQGITRRVLEKEAGISSKLPKHDHKLTHIGIEAQA